MAWMETADLWIRPSEESDLELFYQWERLPEVTQFFSIGDDQSREEVEAVYRRDEADPGRRQYTILLKPEGRPIGRIVLADRIEGWKVEISVFTSRTWRCGEKAMESRPCRLYWPCAFKTGEWSGSIWTTIPATRLRRSIWRWAFNMRGSSERTAGKTASCMTYI